MSTSKHFTVLSLNLRLHNAYDEAFLLARAFDVDIICLQECDYKKVLDTVGEYKLASKTRSSPISLAIYYKDEHFALVDSSSMRLKPAIYERIHKWNVDRLLRVKLRSREDSKELCIASFHATHLVATNSHRRGQVLEAFSALDEKVAIPRILIGDYNYPWFHERLVRLAQKKGYDLHIPTDITFKNRLFRGVFDFVASINLPETKIEVLPTKTSDHNAILLRVSRPAGSKV